MDLLIQDSQGVETRQLIRSGVAGNWDIVYEMVRLIRNAVEYDTGVKRLSSDLLKNARLDSYAKPERQLETVYRFVKQNVAYIQDQAGLLESIKSARQTISDGFGDCDDLTILICTLVGDLGFEDVYIGMAKYEAGPTFQHVYPVVYDGDKRYVMDASLPNASITDEVDPVELQEVPVFKDLAGLDGWSGLFNNIRHNFAKVGKAALGVAPYVSNYLPLGFLSHHAMATGAQMLNHSAQKQPSLANVASEINQNLDEIIVDLVNCRLAQDMAVNMALQHVAQLGAIDQKVPKDQYTVIKRSIQAKLHFIKNFHEYARENDIEVIHLNPHAMLALGAAGAGFGAWTLYKHYFRGK